MIVRIKKKKYLSKSNTIRKIRKIYFVILDRFFIEYRSSDAAWDDKKTNRKIRNMHIIIYSATTVIYVWYYILLLYNVIYKYNIYF